MTILLLASTTIRTGVASRDAIADPPSTISGKHDGRRSPGNPYSTEISDDVRSGLAADDRRGVQRSRFSLFAEPLDPEETPPVPPPAPRPEPTPEVGTLSITPRSDPGEGGGTPSTARPEPRIPTWLLAETDRPTPYNR